MSESVIFGLDGVLANNKHRLHHIEKDPPDWRAFYGQAVVEEDGGFNRMIQLCQQLSESNTIIILTERPIAVSEVTRRWLKWHGISREAVFTRQDRSYDLVARSEEHTSELQSRRNLVCRLLLEKKKKKRKKKKKNREEVTETT